MSNKKDFDEKYEERLSALQIELVQMQEWVIDSGKKIAIIFEGRDAAGKGGTIKRITEHLNPRYCKVVALAAPTEKEKTQWYFQRYVEHLPSAGEIVLFDRSWYNRAGVEKVMGYAEERQVGAFLSQAPIFEKQLVDDGILLFKYWLTTDQARQEERLRERLDDPLKRWKLSPVDLAARDRYEAYTEARETMLSATHTEWAPWTLVDFNDQKRGRLTLVRDLLDRLPDTNVPPEDIELPELGHEPHAERYTLLRPIADYPLN